MDHPNIHSPASVYEAFSPREAKRLPNELAFRHTPRHAGCLKVAGIELSVPGRRRLDQRAPDFEALQAEVETWRGRRNSEGCKIDGRFTAEDVRIRFARLSSSLSFRCALEVATHYANCRRGRVH